MNIKITKLPDDLELRKQHGGLNVITEIQEEFAETHFCERYVVYGSRKEIGNCAYTDSRLH